MFTAHLRCKLTCDEHCGNPLRPTHTCSHVWLFVVMFELMSLVRQSVKHGERQAFWVSKNTWNDKKAVYVPIWQASAALALVFRVLLYKAIPKVCAFVS